MRLSLAALSAVVVTVLSACPPPEPPPPEQQCPTDRRACDSDRVCPGGFCDKDHDSADGVTGDSVAGANDNLGCCVILVCSTNADCDTNEKCDIRRGLCVPKNLCDPAQEGGGQCEGAPCCGATQFCEYTDGAPQCVDSPPDAASCFIAAGGRPLATAPGDTENAPGVVASGADLQLEAIGLDANGKMVAHSTFAFAGTDTSAAGVLNSTCAGPAPCAVTVTATANNGGVSCDGVVNVYAPPADTNRIVLLDLTTGNPVANADAAITIDGVPTAGTTDENGAAEFDAAGGTVNAISVFPADHQWHTIVDPPADVVVYSGALPDRSKVAGISGTFDFDHVHTTGDIKLGLSGTAISAAITDLNFSTLIGEISNYNVILEGVTDQDGQLVPLPSGIVLELGTEPIKGDFVTFGDPGANVAWAIGGQVALSEVGPIISGVAGGGDVNVGNILGGVLPFFAKFDHALVTGLNLTNKDRPTCTGGDFDCGAGQTCNDNGVCEDADGKEVPIDTAVWGFDNNVLTPNTLLSQSVDYAIPTLPCTPGGVNGASCQIVGDGASAFQSGAVLLSGVVVPGIGLVPLGLTAGLDDPDDQDGQDQNDGKLDSKPGAVGAPASGHAIIDYAPPHDGLEGNTFISVAIALDLNTITDGGGLGASIVTHVTKKYGSANDFPAGAFLQSQGGVFTPDDGTGNTGHFDMVAIGDGADFWRVNLDDGADTEWNVWFSDPGTSFDISEFHPNPTEASARVQHADVQAFKLGAGYSDIGPEPADFNDLFAFNGTNLDNLLYYLGAWSSEGCKAGGPCEAP